MHPPHTHTHLHALPPPPPHSRPPPPGQARCHQCAHGLHTRHRHRRTHAGEGAGGGLWAGGWAVCVKHTQRKCVVSPSRSHAHAALILPQTHLLTRSPTRSPPLPTTVSLRDWFNVKPLPPPPKPLFTPSPLSRSCAGTALPSTCANATSPSCTPCWRGSSRGRWAGGSWL